MSACVPLPKSSNLHDRRDPRRAAFFLLARSLKLPTPSDEVRKLSIRISLQSNPLDLLPTLSSPSIPPHVFPLFPSTRLPRTKTPQKRTLHPSQSFFTELLTFIPRTCSLPIPSAILVFCFPTPNPISSTTGLHLTKLDVRAEKVLVVVVVGAHLVVEAAFRKMENEERLARALRRRRELGCNIVCWIGWDFLEMWMV